MPDEALPGKATRIAAHERAPRNKNHNLIDGNDEAALFFDEWKVPVEVIAVANEESVGLDPSDFEVIGEKVSYRLAQRPGSYVISSTCARSSSFALIKSCRVLLLRLAYWTVAAPTSASSPA